METRTEILNETAHKYHENGYVLFYPYSESDFGLIQGFAIDWLYDLLQVKNRLKYPLESYHQWGPLGERTHEEIFKAANRHCVPSERIKELIINETLRIILNKLLPNGCDIWDEGVGWLAFRFIRPGFNDGYPLSCKAWGPAKSVISFWIPISGCGLDTNIGLVPESHLQEHSRYLPENSKFTKDEFRYRGELNPNDLLRPVFKTGEILLFHPKLLHTEAVNKGNMTRLSLEFRIDPKFCCSDVSS